MAKDDGGPAFPGSLAPRDGMSLRDWFAGQALMGLAAAARPIQISVRNGAPREAAMETAAYVLADAMLFERTKP